MRATEIWIQDELTRLTGAGLERRLVPYAQTGPEVSCGGRPLVNLSSNDYLGLANHPRVQASAQEAMQEFGSGATASRLVVGTLECHERLERRLATLKGYPSSLAFGSGYTANVGIVTALTGRDDHIFIDRLAHASLVDASVLSRARIHRFHHNDVENCGALIRTCPPGGHRLILTESVFSMDGDLAPVAELARLADRTGAMMLVDEAHATGVLGPGGAGLVRAAGAESVVNLSMGTLSKALGGYGGFVACTELMRQWLIQRSRSFVYSTALPPAMVGAALGALELLGETPDMGAVLLARAAAFRERLHAEGFNTGESTSQIIPIMVGDIDRTMRLHRRLLEQGILVIPIRPPTVPQGTARLRLSVTLAHSAQTLDHATGIIAAAARAEGVIP